MEYLEQVYYEFTCGTTLFMNIEEQDRTNNSIFDITEKNFEGYVGISFNKIKVLQLFIKLRCAILC